MPEDRVPVEAYERVEIFRGPSAFLNGYVGAVGGTINIVPKRAGNTAITSLAATYGTNGQAGGQADSAGASATTSSSACASMAPIATAIRRWPTTGAPRQYRALARLCRQQRAAGRALRIHQAGQSRGEPALHHGAEPAGSCRANAFSAVQQSWETINTDFYYGMGRGEVDLANDWTAFAAYGQSYFRESWLRTLGSALTTAGTFTSTGQQYSRNFTKQTGEAGVRGRMTTGPVTIRWRWSRQVTGTSSPTRSARPPSPRRPTSTIRSSSTPGQHVQRHAAENVVEHVPVVRAVRHFVDFRRPRPAPARPAAAGHPEHQLRGDRRRDDQLLRERRHALDRPAGEAGTLRLALRQLYRGPEQGPTAPTTAVNAGEVFAPTRSWQIEAGAKVDLGTWSATLGLFQITQPAGITNPTTNVFSVNGQQVNSGIEFNVFGQPLDGFRVLGGTMLFDPRLTQTAGGTFNGKMAPGTSNSR